MFPNMSKYLCLIEHFFKYVQILMSDGNFFGANRSNRWYIFGHSMTEYTVKVANNICLHTRPVFAHKTSVPYISYIFKFSDRKYIIV